MSTKLTMLALALCLIAALSACGGGGSSDESAVRGVLAHELALARKNDFRAAYALLSPNAQDACPYDSWIKGSQGADYSKLGYSNVHVVVNGDHATADYTVTYDGRSGSRPDDRFVKIGGKWYDDADSTDSC